VQVGLGHPYFVEVRRPPIMGESAAFAKGRLAARYLPRGLFSEGYDFTRAEGRNLGSSGCARL